MFFLFKSVKKNSITWLLDKQSKMTDSDWRSAQICLKKKKKKKSFYNVLHNPNSSSFPWFTLIEMVSRQICFFLIFRMNIYCGYSSEAPCGETTKVSMNFWLTIALSIKFFPFKEDHLFRRRLVCRKANRQSQMLPPLWKKFKKKQHKK